MFFNFNLFYFVFPSLESDAQRPVAWRQSGIKKAKTID